VELVYRHAFSVDLCKEMDITELNSQMPLFKTTHKQMDIEAIYQS